ncbi:diguanylate cyclase domain-containing protein [Legionella oakridgensis]|uniref:Sensory box/GGDEF family protein n=1 Tax=Legionella oakridgensis TaxID=29423 RepID=A0A0W0WXX8_9GAMM|nr:diguanylate cyclase [Legionella oakridgensis]ETO92802.1 GGDEF domain protein [Legionella oakridgensis RV-2-2007]KTD37092.1 sensory box/GGDEF family protein [Legionella oakridgensis]STY20599.1 sensory box/GGDEF family protein [Legionella longbeachae]
MYKNGLSRRSLPAKEAKEVAKRLTSCFRVSDFIARMGGDEFAVIIQPIKSPKDAEELAQKIIGEATFFYQIEEKKLPHYL